MENNRNKDIHVRIYYFVIAVLLLIKKLPKDPGNTIITFQLTKSATSMGANDKEADGTTTSKDFIHKYSIVRKEGKETEYWLHIIADTNPSLIKETSILLAECSQIIKIVTAIIYNTQRTRDNKRLMKNK